MNLYCNKLDFKMQPLKEGVDIFNNTTPHVKIPLAHINPEFNFLLRSKSMYVVWAEVFYRGVGSVSQLHCDGEGGDYTKINWVFGGENSSMNWFSLRNPSLSQGDTESTSINSQYRVFSYDDVVPEATVNLLGTYLVQVGVPHNVINPSTPRHCLSFFINNKQGKRVGMNDAYNSLQEFIV